MDFIQQAFSVQFQYKVFFTTHLFQPANPVFRHFLQGEKKGTAKKILFVMDEGVVLHHPRLESDISKHLKEEASVSLASFLTVQGGEEAKNNKQLFYHIVESIHKYGIDRHSYVAAIGGGSVLDLVGYAAAVSHRGIRHIRIPTTVLSQNDSGVGVKNGINYFSKKNFLGTFAPPVAVFNDAHFLTTLSARDWRSGVAEAVKVALIKDASFFCWLEENGAAMAAGNREAMNYQVRKCAELHMEHIRGGDPFEMGSSRPLDFGHWSAHKLEQISHFSIRHGEAVAMGIALDSTYSYLSGRLSKEELMRIITLLETLGLEITHPLMQVKDHNSPLLDGLNEFREHLGGELTIMLLKKIGKGEEVHEMDAETIRQAGEWLQDYTTKKSSR